MIQHERAVKFDFHGGRDGSTGSSTAALRRRYAELLNLTGPGREEKFELIIDLTSAFKGAGAARSQDAGQNGAGAARPPPAATPRQQAAAAKARPTRAARRRDRARRHRPAHGRPGLKRWPRSRPRGWQGAAPRVLRLSATPRTTATRRRATSFLE